MRDRLTSLIAIALLVTLCAMSYWYSVKAELENVTHLSDLNSPDFIARDITITQFDDDGIAKAKVFAKEVEHYSDGHANAKFPEYASLNPNEVQITAKSDRATMVDGGAVIHFYDNVDIRQAATKDAPASRLLTSQLDAYPDTDTYKSDKPVALTRGEDTSHGVGMDYDNVDRTFKLRSRVQTVIQPKTVKEVERKQP